MKTSPSNKKMAMPKIRKATTRGIPYVQKKQPLVTPFPI
jgi:hypothetical protein